jgi:hypothetical protein
MATTASLRPVDWIAYTVCRLLPAAGLLAGAGLIGEQFVKTARFVASQRFSGEVLGYVLGGLFLAMSATFFLGVLDWPISSSSDRVTSNGLRCAFRGSPCFSPFSLRPSGSPTSSNQRGIGRALRGIRDRL